MESPCQSKLLAGATAGGEEHTQNQSVSKGQQPMGRAHAGAGEKCEEEGEAEMKCYGLTTTSISIPLYCSV